jgi:hypothetical protein
MSMGQRNGTRVTDIDGLAETFKQAIPETCRWDSETVHES